MAAASPVFRLFVSSTFDDMRDERQALHERVFPELGRRCRAHSTRFQPIDLRWGVSEAAARDHRAVEICLAEIDRCRRQTRRPNFLFLLGDRYGWCPAPARVLADELGTVLDGLGDRPGQQRLLRHWYRRDDNAVPPEYVLRPLCTADDRAFVAAERAIHEALRAGARIGGLDAALQRYERSATHLEIERGVLSVADAHEHVIGVMRSLDGSTGAPYVDVLPDGRPDEDARRRLAGLRDELRRCLPSTLLEYRAALTPDGVARDYLDRLCADVLARLWALIEAELERQGPLDGQSAEESAHRSFAAARVRQDGSDRPGNAVRTVLDHVHGDLRAPLVVTGPSGVGKSTLAAQATERLADESGVDLFARFVGVTASAGTALELLTGLAREVDRRFGRAEEPPADYDGLVAHLWSGLAAVPPGRRAVLVVDGVDLLDARSATARLDWISAEPPPRVRVVVSAAPGPACDRLLGMPGRQVLELQPLTRDDARPVLDRWMAEQGRTLQPDQRRLVLDRFAADGMPLHLRLAVQDALRWSSDLRVGQLSLAADADGIVRDLFRRLSADAEHGAILVRRTLAFLVSGRSGLAEDELLAVLSADPDVMDEVRRRFPHWPLTGELPTAVWSRLHADLEPYLVERRTEGTLLLGFLHHRFEQVVAEQTGPPEIRRRHDDLARFFLAQPLTAEPPDLRALSEVPYQLGAAGRRAELVGVLTEFGFLQAKLGALGPQALLDDVALAAGGGRRTGDTALDMVAQVLEQAFAVLARHPDELPAQLHGRLLDHDDDAVRALLAGARQTARRPWLRPLSRSLSPPGGALTRMIVTHGGDITAVAVSPDGGRALAACRDGTIEVRDLRRGELVRTLHGHGVFARCVAMTPDGHRAVSGGRIRPYEDGQELRVWDLDQGRPIAAHEGHDHDFGEVVVLPDGDRAVSSSYDGTIRVWDLDSGAAQHVLRGHSWYVRALAVTPDGRLAASGSDDGTIGIWDLERGVHLRTLETAHVAGGASPEDLAPGALIGVTQVLGVALTPDGELLVSASPQEGLWIWDVGSGARVARLDAAGADSPRITADGQRLVFLRHSCVEVWDLPRRTRLGRTDPMAFLPTALAVTPDGRIAVTGSGAELRVWRLDRLADADTDLRTGIAAAAVVDDGGAGIAVVAGRAAIEGRSLATGEQLWRRADTGASDLAPVPGRAAAVVGRADGVVELLDATSGAASRLGSGRGGPFSIRAVAVDPGGRRAASVAAGVISVWDLANRRLVRRMSAPHHDAKALAFTPDGAMLVSAADTGAYAGDRVLKRWDLRSGVEIGAESGRERRRNRRRRGRDMRSSMSTPHQTRPLAVTGDGRSAVSALTGSGLRVWDLATGAEIGVLLDGMVDETVHALPGRRVLAPDGYNESAAVVWDLDAREPLGRLAASGVLVLDTTADGRRAATVARNLRAVLWDLAEHRALAGITLEDFAQACVLAPDGETLVVGDRRTVHLLRVMPGSGAAPAP